MTRSVTLIKNFLIYTLGIVFWSVIIIGFLYFPRIFESSWQKKELNILAFPQIIDKEYLAEFEKKMGVQVNITYFESSEDLLTKLHNTTDHGYDLFMISDFFLPELIRCNFIKPIDTKKLRFFNDVYPALLGHTFDPLNKYSIPCFWSVYGIGFDASLIAQHGLSVDWSLLFLYRPYIGSVGMLEDVREIFALAGYYLFGTTGPLNHDQMAQATQLLMNQKKWVAVYTDMRSEYLLAGNTVTVGLTTHSDFAKVAKHYSKLQFEVPAEGSFVKIDSYVMAANTDKEDLVYEFLNYVHNPVVMQKYVDKFQFFPTLSTVFFDHVIPGCSVPTHELFGRLHFFQPQLDSQIAEHVWIQIKAS